MLKKIVDRIFMKKEINLKHLSEIDKVHDLSSHLFSKVNKMMSGVFKKGPSEASDTTVGTSKENNQVGSNSNSAPIKRVSTGVGDTGVNKNKL